MVHEDLGQMTSIPFTPQQYCLLQLSAGVWERRRAAKLAGLTYNEETVTEVLLLELQINFPGHVLIVPFTKRREARIGADWAWAFVSHDRRSNQGMLVQAKRLDDKERNYDSLYKKNRLKGETHSRLQMDRLIENARRYQLPPVYAFYNQLDNPSRIPHFTCGTLGGLYWRCPESWGVALASAVEVRRAKPNRSFDRHKCHSMPLHCLLCSEGSGQRDADGSPGAAAASLTRLFARSVGPDDLGSDLSPPFEPAAELSEIFQEAERVHHSEHLDHDGMIAKLNARFPGLAGAVIIRDNEDSDRTSRSMASMPWPK